MISHFFIDRPIFATVLSILITVAGGLAVFTLPVAQYPPISPPQVQVAISYPGASAQVVADTVAAPIEQQVNGVPGMLYMTSLSGNDGTYTLFVTFDVGVDLNTALVMVQNRVQLALPLLPTSVQNQGITIRKKTPDILMVISLYSPDGRYDNLYLSNFALIHLYDPVLRVDGVSDITIVGELENSMRAWLDLAKACFAQHQRCRRRTGGCRTKTSCAAPGQLGQPPSRTAQAFNKPIDMLVRLTDPKQFGDVIVTVGNPAPTSATAARPPVVRTRSSMSASQTATANARPVGLPGFSVATLSAATMTTANGTASGTTTTSSGTAMTSGTISPNTSGSTAVGMTSSAMSGTSMNYSGGANAAGGGTTAGGGGTGGGATTGGAAGGNTAGVGTSANVPPTGIGIPGLSINASSAAGGTTAAGGSSLPGPQPPATAIVRLRDVARTELGALNYNEACTFPMASPLRRARDLLPLPGTNALNLADRVSAQMAELKTRFPEGIDYVIAYNTTPFIHESVIDVVHTLLVGGGPCWHRRARFPAESAGGGADPNACRPGCHRRHLCSDGGRRLQLEQHLAFRAGAGDRHRGRRCHSRGRKRRAVVGSRLRSARCRAECDG